MYTDKVLLQRNMWTLMTRIYRHNPLRKKVSIMSLTCTNSKRRQSYAKKKKNILVFCRHEIRWSDKEPIKVCACIHALARPVLSNQPAATAGGIDASLIIPSAYGTQCMHRDSLMHFTPSQIHKVCLFILNSFSHPELVSEVASTVTN